MLNTSQRYSNSLWSSILVLPVLKTLNGVSKTLTFPFLLNTPIISSLEILAFERPFPFLAILLYETRIYFESILLIRFSKVSGAFEVEYLDFI